MYAGGEEGINVSGSGESRIFKDMSNSVSFKGQPINIQVSG